MGEKAEHKELKKCACDIFGGQPEKTVNGRVDIKSPTFCVEVEISRRTDRLEHAIEKLSSSACGGGFLIVPRDAVGKAEKLVGDRPIISIPIDKFSILCKLRRQGLSQSSTTK